MSRHLHTLIRELSVTSPMNTHSIVRRDWGTGMDVGVQTAVIPAQKSGASCALLDPHKQMSSALLMINPAISMAATHLHLMNCLSSQSL